MGGIVTLNRIFIGSSTEALDIAKALKKYLSATGLDVVGWWDTSVFRPGGYILDSLLHLSRQCQGAIFIHAADDSTWYREQMVAKTRDNVVFEYGIFLSRRGSQHVIVLKEETEGDNPKVALNTDILGVKYISYGQKEKDELLTKEGNPDVIGSDTPWNEIFVHFNHRIEKGVRHQRDVQVVSIGDVDSKILSGVYKSWSSRAIYIGHNAAKHWIAFSSADENTPAGKFYKLITKINSLIGSRSFNSVISFGPGDGKIDKKILMHIKSRSKSRRVNYIPVDISPFLLQQTLNEIKGSDIDVPIMVHGDIEDDLGTIMNYISYNTADPRLFIILGGTFANIEESESTFFLSMKSHIGKNDLILFDAYIKGKNYQPEIGPIIEKVGNKKTQYRELLANATSIKTGESIKEILEKFDDRFTVKEAQEASVSNTSSYKVIDESLVDFPHQQDLVHFRRYDFSALSSWLSGDIGLEILDSGEIYDDEYRIGRGIFLLRNKDNC